MYKTRDREAGNTIELFTTYEDAKAAVERYEAEDKAEGIFEENFYEIVETEGFEKRESDHLTYDRAGMHHTGYECLIHGIWWYEFEDEDGKLWYFN